MKAYPIRELEFRDCKTFARLPPRALVYPPTSPTAIAPPYIPKQRSPLHIPNSDRSHISKSDRVYSQTWNGNEEVAITTI
ncbi:MAG: hypothetical protein ACKPKF_19660 [Microcystis panniformis]